MSGPDAGPEERSAGRRRVPTGFVGAVLVTLLLALYAWQVAGRGVAMVRTGQPVLVAIGLGVLVIPLLVLGLIAVEYRLAARVQRMADALAAAGQLPVDDLPRSPGGRIDRAAADAAFAEYRAAVEAEPESWQAWYRLAFAYDAAGDRKRARASLRKASSLF